MRQTTIFDEMIIDNFAGGGGASTGIEAALGRAIDLAINHNAEAMAMHKANHPYTHHYCEDVFSVDPKKVTNGRPVGLAWFSPDCKHFSKAKGGKPKDKKIRGLAWVAIRWAASVQPRTIFLENVEEWITWGPLLPDGTPDPEQKGIFFKAFVRKLEKLGYQVEVKELKACDYGAPTTRKRLFLIARNDGQPIVWPEPTHGAPNSPAVKAGIRKPWRTAAECIDWSLPMESIFERKKPLAGNTLRRIVAGLNKFSAKPFIVTGNHAGDGFRGINLQKPWKTITASRDDDDVIFPVLIQSGYGERPGQAPRALDLDNPLGTTMGEGVKHALAVAWLVKNYGGNQTPGSAVDAPVDTITTQDHNCLAIACLSRQFGNSIGSELDEPMGAVMPGGGGKTSLVSFLMKYYSSKEKETGNKRRRKAVGNNQSIDEPLHTIRVRDGFALITIKSVDYIIVDILYRMLQPHELFKAQGFPDDYIITPEFKGKPMTKTAQVRMCGNSVSPAVAEALVRANYIPAKKLKKRA